MRELISRWDAVGCAALLLTLAAMLGCQGMNLAPQPAPSLGNGTSPSQVGVSPATVNFGDVVVGTARRQTGTLSAANARATVTSATLSSPEFALSGLSFPLTIAAGQSASFTVTFTPQTTGAASGSLFFVSDANTPTVASLTGTGTTAPQHYVDLSWNASTSQVVGYNVHRGTQSGGPYIMINPVLNASANFRDNNVQAGHTYFYVVTAVDGKNNESNFSKEVQAAIPTP